MKEFELFELINQFESRLEDFTEVPLSGGRIVVKKDEFHNLLNDIKNSLPKEFLRAKELTQNYEMIISTTHKQTEQVINNARLESRRMLEDATQRAEELVKNAEQRASQILSEHEIIKNAKLKAQEILRKAEMDSNLLINQTLDGLSNTLKESEKVLYNSLNDVSNNIKNLQARKR